MYANQQQGSTEIQFGAWTLSLKSQTITDGQVSRELEPLVYGVLLYLLENHDRIVSKAELTDYVWRQKHVDDNAINRAFSVLRKTLKSAKQPGVVVKTHYRKGYAIIVPVSFKSSKQSPDPLNVTESQTINQPNNAPVKAFRSIYYKVGVTGGLILICLIFWLVWPKSKPISEREKATELGQLLTWSNGVVGVPVLNQDESLLAFSNAPEGTDDDWLSVKSLKTEKVYDVFAPNIKGDEAFAVAFSSTNELYFQLVNYRYQTRCEMWKADLSAVLIDSKATIPVSKVFDCKSKNVISGTVVNNDKTLIYVKHYYKGLRFAGRLVARDLASGEEIQVSTPPFNTKGEWLVTSNPQKDRLAYLRFDGTDFSVLTSKLDGSDVKQWHKSKTVKHSLQWSQDGQELFWLASENPYELVTLQLETGEMTRKHLFSLDNKKFPHAYLASTLTKDKKLILASHFLESTIKPFKVQNNQLVEQTFSDLPWEEEFGEALHDFSQYLFITHKQVNAHDVWLYDDEVAKKIGQLTSEPINMAVSPAQQQVAILVSEAEFSARIDLYSIRPFKKLQQKTIPGQVKYLRWLDENNLLFDLAKGEQEVQLWRYQVESQKLIDEQQPCFCLFGLIVNDSHIFSVSKDGDLYKHLLKSNSQKAIRNFKNGDFLSVNVDGNVAANMNYSREIELFDWQTNRQLKVLPLPTEHRAFSILSFKDNKLLLKLSKIKNNNLYLYDTKQF